MELVNDTPFPAIGWPTADPTNQTFITVVARVKYLFDTLDKKGLWSLKLDQDQGTLFETDIYYEDEEDIVRFECDYVPYKRQADLVINLSKDRAEYGTKGVEVFRYTSFSDKDTLLKHMSMKNLGFLHRADKLRTQWQGTYDENWVENIAPKYPSDFNENYYNAVHPKMQLVNKYFEPGDIIHFHKLLYGEHKQSVMIPGVYLIAKIHNSIDEPSMLLEADTIVCDVENIDRDKNCIYISYRNRIALHNKVNKVHLKMMLEKEFIAQGEENGR